MPAQPDPVFRFTFPVPADALDENGHVNNVRYVQWMQDAAMRHYEAMGGIPPVQALGATWVVREHRVTYLRPALLGDVIEVHTWVADLRRVRSLRRYRFVRVSDGAELARGETDWVFVDAASGRPRAVPAEIAALFSLHPEE